LKKNSLGQVFGAILLFILVGSIISTKFIQNVDQFGFNVMKKIASTNVDNVSYFLRDFGSTKAYIFFSIIFLIIAAMKKKIMNGVYLLITVLTSRVLVTIIKGFYDRPRPITAFYHESGSSFPSGHALMATCFFLTLCFLLMITFPTLQLYKKQLNLIAILFILLISLSRIYLNVHHVSDIFAGWCAGYVWYVICRNTYLFLLRNRQF